MPKQRRDLDDRIAELEKRKEKLVIQKQIRDLREKQRKLAEKK